MDVVGGAYTLAKTIQTHQRRFSQTCDMSSWPSTPLEDASELWICYPVG